ncbi:hypothetical protein DXG01_005249 [Tephrocybe rancida]|nr:hypothetical protein DXG01_005249 [Tephrocybe rancida]
MTRKNHQNQATSWTSGGSFERRSQTRNVQLNTLQIDVLHWTGRAALEIIGQSALGYSFDTLEEGAEPHAFGVAANEFSSATDDLLFLREYCLPTLIKIGSPRFRRFFVDHLPWGKLRRLRDIVDTMDRVTTQIFEEKKKELVRANGASKKQERRAKDLMSILMEANMDAAEDDRLPDHEVLTQFIRGHRMKNLSTFAFAGTDTTSNILSRALDLLSRNPEIQDKLRAEVIQARGDFKDTDTPYGELMSLPFMDAVCRETLRLHPPITFVTRVATEDCIVPLSSPLEGVDGRSMASITVPINTKIFVSIFDINRDPTLWGSDSSEWKPERWLSPLPQALQDAHVPGVYSHLSVNLAVEAFPLLILPSMTFLGGARACIGFKFSELEMSK